MRRVVVVLLAGAGLSIAILGQERERPPGIFRAASQISAELEQSTPELGIVAGQRTQVVEANGGRILVRRRQAGPNNASVHNDVTEVYQIISGGGTFVTGGTIPDPANRTAGTRGGVAQQVQVGDFVVLPPGTPHWFSQIDGSITYVETRFPVAQ